MSLPPVVDVRGLSKTYRTGLLSRGFRALDGIDLAVAPGTVFGLLGPNGAGKTTLVKILLGLVQGWGGRATLLGAPAGDTRTRRRIGYLPESHRLPGYLTARQALELYGLYSGRSRQWLAGRIDPWLERLGMREAGDRKIREYSKGMAQRIGLALALVHEPELVFLDEPTDGVDPVGRRQVLEIVSEARDRGVTIFLNSHLLMEVETICDRVVILSRGRVLREGTVAELTPPTGRVRFQLAHVPDALPDIVAGLGKDLELLPDGFEVDVDEATQNEIVDRLRGARLLLRSMTPRRSSLEESFLDLLREKKP